MRSVYDVRYIEINTLADAQRAIRAVLALTNATIDDKWVCIGGLYRFYTDAMSSADRKQANLAVMNAQGDLLREKEGMRNS